MTFVDGNGGRDFISGGRGNDVLLGGTGRDTIYGGRDNDLIRGDADNDWLSGSRGNDTIDGGAGYDLIRGGSGADVFEFNAGNGTDNMLDFRNGHDKIDVSGLGIESFAEIAHDIRGKWFSTIIDLGDGDQMILSGTNARHIDAVDFIFA